jgi:uncharacterized membrane protein (DUF485 family)
MSGGPSRLDLLNDPEFRAMAAAKNRISTILTLVTLVVYFGFVFMVAFWKDFFGWKLPGTRITAGMPLGVGVIIASWILTGLYVRWANRRYDSMVLSIKEKVANGASAGRPGPG